ncbi:MAG TPA: c-type cytochrome biogenesis protein CcmI [Burkholderiales bacterium]|nr:c-type cytochrome biogenesis protein CcmI [Burkholderiales bacterium]
MAWFALVAIALTGTVVVFLVFALLRSNRNAMDSRREANVSIYRDQFSELERDLESGTLDSSQYVQARAELEQRLLDDVQGATQSKTEAARSARMAALIVAIMVPLGAGLLYLHLGNPEGLTAPKRSVADASSITVDQFKDMTEKLAARLERKPDDAVGWMMLGRAYKVLERYPDAVKALQRAEELEPRNPEILVDYAEALALDNGHNLEGEPTRLLERSLQIAPDNEKALTLAGTAAFARSDYASAVRHWQRLVAKLPADSELGRALSSGIAEAKARAAGKAALGNPARRPSDASKSVSGTVRLSPLLVARASPDDTVFIFVRAAEGPKMPLAVLKKQVKDLPLSFKLDDSMSMTPGLELSAFARVVVGARISKSGSATPKAGDLEGKSRAVEPGASGVQVTIDSPIQ